MWLSAAAVGALLTGSSRLRAQDPEPASRPAKGKLTYEQFLTEMLPHARRVVASKGEDEEAYLMTIAAAMSRLQDPSAPLRDTMRNFRKQHGKSGERFPLMAITMQLKPGRGFSHHDHWNYNGVIMGIEGEVRIRNYDFPKEVPAYGDKKTFSVRMTSDDWILPGRISTLGQNRENIHDVTAGKNGAHVLDVFTFFAPGATSRYLEVDDKPRDAETRTYDAAWK